MSLQDVAGERGIIAGLLVHGTDTYLEVADLANTSTFTEDIHQVFFKCIEHVCKDGIVDKIDIPTLMSAAQSLNIYNAFESSHTREYLKKLYDLAPAKEGVRKLAGKIRRLEITRMLKSQLARADRDLDDITGDEKISHIMGIAEAPIFDFSSLLRESESSEADKMGKGAKQYAQYLLDNPREQMGIPTGFTNLDKAIGGGLRKKGVGVVGARLKVGKTTVTDNAGLYISGKLLVPVLNLDTEMDRESHLHRMLANISGVTIDEIECGKFGKYKQQVMEAAEYLENIPYDYRSICGEPFEDTIASIRRWIKKKVGYEPNGECKPCVIILDYLKMMSADGMDKLAEWQMLGFQMTSFVNLMIRTGGTGLSLIQLNRDGINKEDTDVFSGSDRVGWFANSLTIFKPKSQEEMAEQPHQKGVPIYNRKFVPIVSRYGPGVEQGDYINVHMQGEYARLTEGPTRNQLQSQKPATGFVVDKTAEDEVF